MKQKIQNEDKENIISQAAVMLNLRYPRITKMQSKQIFHNRTGSWLRLDFETANAPGRILWQLFALEKIGPCWDVWPVSQINSNIKSEGIRNVR